jgi:hypothetical protein
MWTPLSSCNKLLMYNVDVPSKGDPVDLGNLTDTREGVDPLK